MQHLRELIELGFSPMMAMVMVAVIILWGSLTGVVVFGFRQFITDRRERDRLRIEQLTEINERLQASEEKHEECDQDRRELHRAQETLRDEVSRLRGCPRANCPLRLPP